MTQQCAAWRPFGNQVNRALERHLPTKRLHPCPIHATIRQWIEDKP